MIDTDSSYTLEGVFERVEQLLLAYTGERGSDKKQVLDGLGTDSEPSHRSDDGLPASATETFRDRLERLVNRFELDEAEQTVFLLALTPDLDARFSHAFSRLHGSRTLRRPTVDILADILERTGYRPTTALETVSASSPLVRWQLLEVRPRGTDTPFRSRIVSVTQRVLTYLLGGEVSTLETEYTVIDTDKSIATLPVSEKTRTRLQNLPADPPNQPAIHYFSGVDTSVQHRAVEATTTASGTSLVRTDALSVAHDRASLDSVVREALLQDASIHLTAVHELIPETTDSEPTQTGESTMSIDDLVRELDTVPVDSYLTGTTPWTPTVQLSTHEFIFLEFPKPGYELRRQLWEQRTAELPAGVTPTELAGTFELTQGEVDAALTTARAISNVHEDDVETITRDGLFEACKLQSSANLEALAERIEPNYSWEDIWLPEDTESHLREVAARITNRGTVYSEWGFEQKFARGIGVVALFSGPSGTGKTMAAEVLANHAGLDLYRIDLSTVVSKYIGETEENLEQIFDEAEQSSAILLFDEADAVFGERSEVSDSTDRYANVEVNYLLQRIEHYDGVVLLTTNYESNIDTAFLRRIHLHVEFSRPDREIRAKLWRGVFPDETPTDDLDYAFLSDLELSGGEIRNAAQTAAFNAASENDPVTMAHLVPAVRRELEKTGSLIDPTTFGEYRELLTN